MKKTKKWYDYLWIVSALYLILGFFNILFAWLGLICFFVPLAIAIISGNKAYCSVNACICPATVRHRASSSRNGSAMDF